MRGIRKQQIEDKKGVRKKERINEMIMNTEIAKLMRRNKKRLVSLMIVIRIFYRVSE